MPLYKFKTFEEEEAHKKKGMGHAWYYAPDQAYLNKALHIRINAPFPRGIYKFKSFQEAKSWEMEWWIKNGTEKGTG